MIYESPAHRLAISRGMLCLEDVDLIQEVVALIPHDERPGHFPVVIDIGAGSGTTALAVFSTGRKVDVHTIDIDQSNLDWAEAAITNENPAWLDHWFDRLQDSASWATHFDDRSVSLVMVDGDHSYEGVAADIKAWLPKLRPGGFMWFHDYNGPERYGGELAIEEALADGKLLRRKRAGWGLLTVKP